MAITSTKSVRQGNVVTVTVTSSLTGTVFYHWYVDGAYVASTQTPQYRFALDVGEQARVEIVDTNDANFDPIAGGPDAYPARRTIWWVRSLDADVVEYRVEESWDGANYTPIGSVPRNEEQWSYSLLTRRMHDMANQAQGWSWRVVPVDKAGNDGSTSLTMGTRVVRYPDAPGFELSYSAGTQRVTFS
ncbi:MAG: hypothetical protein AABZ12_08370 [Planctomycetota bacterium]